MEPGIVPQRERAIGRDRPGDSASARPSRAEGPGQPFCSIHRQAQPLEPADRRLALEVVSKGRASQGSAYSSMHARTDKQAD